ncbi:MAG: ComEC/Rec2 family competence protein, partial [Flavobacteriales bacterium]|nr:ComEC/Rec2 family competence protein [Flavobacteriales bacterium]
PGVKLALILIFLWLYAGITGLSPSVLRAATMFSFVALGSISKKKSNTYNMLAASAILLIIIDPGIVFQVGFQLSYLAVIGIVFTFPRIYPLLVFNSIVLDKIWSLVVVSIGAQLATFPLSLYYFHQFPLVFLITNLIVIPLATLALYSGLFYLIFNWIPGIDWILYKVFNGTLWAMNSFIEIVSQLPYAVLRDIPFTVGEMLLAYIFMIAATLAFYTPRRDYIRTTLFALLAMVSISSARLIANSTRWEVTILEGRNSPVVCIQKGNSLTVLSVEETKLDFDADNSFYLEGFYRKQGIHDVRYIAFSGNYKDAFLRVSDGILIVPNQVIQLTAQSEDSSLAENCFGNVSIIHRRENLKRIAHCGEQTTLLMGREIPKWKRRDIFELVDRDQVAIWDMNADGIYRRKVP